MPFYSYRAVDADGAVVKGSMEGSDIGKENAVRNGMKTMRDNGIKKASEGRTTFEEVLRVVG